MDSKNKKNPLYELMFNIVIPVLLLNKLSSQFEENGPLIALVVALSFPIGYFLWDLIKTRHISIISILGFVNILLTGVFALFELNSFWFAVKETSIPLLIGIGVGLTTLTKKPLINKFLEKEELIDQKVINEALEQSNNRAAFNKEFSNLTLYLALTFFISAILNYIVTINIVIDIPPEIIGDARLTARNDQIAELTWKSYFIIMAPSMLMLGYIIWRTNNILKKYIGVGLSKVLIQQ